MKYRYLSDCHVHTDCSADGVDPAMMMCDSASRLGLYALTITDHCECNVYREEEYDRAVRQSFFGARKAGAVFRDRLHVMAGVELGQPLQNLDAVEDALTACSFDFVLASLHNLKGMRDFYFLDYKSMDIDALLHRYFDEVYEMVQWGNFDSLAHLTYPLRYITGDQGIQVNLDDYREKIDAILESLAKQGKALEVNTSGLRQKIRKILPTAELVKRFHDVGGRYVTLGSDAHRWPDVGAGLERGMFVLQEAGFKRFTIFVKREAKLLPIE